LLVEGDAAGPRNITANKAVVETTHHRRSLCRHCAAEKKKTNYEREIT